MSPSRRREPAFLKWSVQLRIAVVAVLEPVFGFGDDGSGGERDRFPRVYVVRDQLVDRGETVVLELESRDRNL